MILIYWFYTLSPGLPFSRGIFPTQGSNSGLPYCRQIHYQLSHKGSPRILEWVTYPFSRGSSWPRNQTGVSCSICRYQIELVNSVRKTKLYICSLGASGPENQINIKLINRRKTYRILNVLEGPHRKMKIPKWIGPSSYILGWTKNRRYEKVNEVYGETKGS